MTAQTRCSFFVAKEGAMDFLSSFTDVLADDRLAANLIAAHGIITAMVVVSLILRQVVIGSGSRLLRWTRLRWLEAAGEEAARRARTMLFWLTVSLILLTAVGGVGYHLAGRDIRLDLGT